MLHICCQFTEQIGFNATSHWSWVRACKTELFSVWITQQHLTCTALVQLRWPAVTHWHQQVHAMTHLLQFPAPARTQSDGQSHEVALLLLLSLDYLPAVESQSAPQPAPRNQAESAEPASAATIILRGTFRQLLRTADLQINRRAQRPHTILYLFVWSGYRRLAFFSGLDVSVLE